MDNRIVVIGLGGHAKAVVDTVERTKQYTIEGFVDRQMSEVEYRGYRVVGVDDDLDQIYSKGVHKAVIAIGYMDEKTYELRQKLFNKLIELGYELPAIIDPSAIISEDVKVGKGVWIGKNVIVNADAVIEDLAIVNTGAIVEHDCIIGTGSHVSVGVVVCGGVKLGEGCMIGANSTLIQGVNIGKHALIGAGSVVTKDVMQRSKVKGVPAK